MNHAKHLAWRPARHRSPENVSLSPSHLSPTPAQEEQDTRIIKSLSPFLHKETKSPKDSLSLPSQSRPPKLTEHQFFTAAGRKYLE